jgi:hypothetical protein
MRLPLPGQSGPVLAAAPCSSSRPSREAAGGEDRCRRAPGSIRHDEQSRHFCTDCHPSSPPLSAWPRRCSPGGSETNAIQPSSRLLAAAQAAVCRRYGQYSAISRSPVHFSAHEATHAQDDGRVEILIASPNCGWCPAPRAFLLRRLSNAGPPCMLRDSASAGIRNPSGEQTFKKFELKAANPSRADALDIIQMCRSFWGNRPISAIFGFHSNKSPRLTR